MGIVAILALGARMSLLSRVPLEYPPPVLAAKAREIAGRLGYDQRPLDTAYGFRGAGREFVRKMRAADPAARSWEGAILMRPPLVRFWYRDSPRLLEPISFFGRPGGGAVSWFDPPSDVSGMKALELDTEGRLVSFSAVPPQVDDPPPATVREPDWPVLFAAAGLDPARFRTAAPRWAPAGLADSRAAWEGTYADRPSLTVRVEAAGYRGRPTYFEIVTPWTRPARMQEFRPTPGQRAGQIIATTMLLAMTVGGLLVVRRSLRLGRGDRRGAVRLAVFAIAASCLGWALGADHVANLSEVGLIVMAVCWSLFMGALVWMLYVAAEPFVRRRWPGVLISWTRLLAGRLRDPLVGRDLLLGAALGVAIVLSGTLQAIVRRALGAEPETGVLSFSFALLPTRDVFSQLCFQPLNAVFVAVLVLFFLVLLRALLRREWLAASAFVLVFSAPSILQPETTAFDAAFRIAISVAVVLVVIRAGMVAAVAGFVTINLLGTAWIGTDLTAWYTLPAWINVSVVAVLALYGFHTALAGRPLFKDGLLEP
jgi:serine/threonine-protein kinase